MPVPENAVISGFALIDKPAGWTSHDVVARLRRLYGQRRVGHAGTLDPMATGVLVIGLGDATRLLRFVQDQPKTYRATIRFGISTITDDAEGEVTGRPGWEWDPAGLSAALGKLTGPILQVPSAVSAVKVDGVRSYARVRAGEQVELAARPVVISRFEMVGPPRPVPGEVPVLDIDAVVECSSGTYVRALARDLGEDLGSAAHLVALRRTAISGIEVRACVPPGDDPPPVADVETVMAGVMQVLQVPPEAASALRMGQHPHLPGPNGLRLAVDERGGWVSVVDLVDGRPEILVNRPDR